MIAAVVLKLGTAVPLESAKHFRGDRKGVADFQCAAFWRDRFDMRRVGLTYSSLGRLDVKTIRRGKV